MIALSINRLTKKFGQFIAVDDVSFEIKEGEVFGLLGPNGAGKTTIISNIVTLQAPTKGSIDVLNKNVHHYPINAKLNIGYVPQELISHGFFTVEEILKFHGAYFGKKVDPLHLKRLLKKLHLWDHRKKSVNLLSGGMKRRLLILKALLHKPKLLLLDEPTAGVDVQLRNSIWQFIEELKREKISILLTTHYLEEAEYLCDRIGILDHGKLHHIDTTEQMIEKHSSKHVSITLAFPLSPLSHPYLNKQTEKTLHFIMPNKAPLGPLLKESALALNAIADIEIKKGRLEEVMNNLTREEVQ